MPLQLDSCYYCSSVTFALLKQIQWHWPTHHPHHHNAKHLAEASCLQSSTRSVHRQLQCLSCCDTHVAADLVDPGSGKSTTGTSPLLCLVSVQIRRIWFAGTVCENQATWPETQSSFVYDKCNVIQTGAAQHFVVGHKVMPANVQDVIDTAYERSPVFSNQLVQYKSPCFRCVATLPCKMLMFANRCIPSGNWKVQLIIITPTISNAP